MLVEEDKNTQSSFIKDIKEDKISIIRKTANTKEIYYEENGKNYLAITMPEADKFAQSFIEKKIDSTLYCEEENTDSKKYDILYSTVLFPDKGKDARNLMEIAKDSLKSKVEAVL